MGLLSRFFGSQNAAEASPVREIDATTVREWQQQGACVLIDIREDSEHRRERIAGARLAPLSRLQQALPTLPAGTKAVFLCQSGMRTRAQAVRLAGCGFAEAYNLAGGMMAWKARGFPVERG